MLLGLLQIHSLSLPKENVEDQTIILNGNITTVQYNHPSFISTPFCNDATDKGLFRLKAQHCGLRDLSSYTE